MEMHVDAISAGERIVLWTICFATAARLAAAAVLIRKLGVISSKAQFPH